MKRRTRVFLQLTSLCLMLGAYGFAADNAYLYIVHGIPGRDIATTLSPAYPIDVLLNGDTCIPRNLPFASVSGPYSFSPGTYQVMISKSNTLAPCTNSAILTGEVTLNSGTSVSVVAAIVGGQPTLLQFNDNLSQVSSGFARFVFAQSADGAALEATLTQQGVKNPKTYTVTVNPGAEGTLPVPEGSYQLQVFAAGSTTVLVSETIVLSNQSVTFAYADGQLANNTIGLITKAVPVVL